MPCGIHLLVLNLKKMKKLSILLFCVTFSVIGYASPTIHSSTVKKNIHLKVNGHLFDDYYVEVSTTCGTLITYTMSCPGCSEFQAVQQATDQAYELNSEYCPGDNVYDVHVRMLAP